MMMTNQRNKGRLTIVPIGAPVIRRPFGIGSGIGYLSLQCFDAVGWAAGRASGL